MGQPSTNTKTPVVNKEKSGGVAQAICCQVSGCKTSPSKFDFCSEHFSQFKFGLVTKTGKPAADYEKKFDQYQLYKKRLAGQKAA